MKRFKKKRTILALVIAAMLATISLFSFTANAAQSAQPVSVETEADTTTVSLKTDTFVKLNKILYDLSTCTNEMLGNRLSYESYNQISAIFDEIDNAYNAGEIDDTQYDDIMDMTSELCSLIFEQYERFNFNPYEAQTTYEAPLDYMMDRSYVSASFNAAEKSIILHCHWAVNMRQAGVSGRIMGVTAGSYGAGQLIGSSNSLHSVDYVTYATLSPYVGSIATSVASSGHIFVYAVSGLGSISLDGGYVGSNADFNVHVTNQDYIKAINNAGAKWNGSYWGYAADDTEATWSSSTSSVWAKSIDNWSAAYSQWYSATQHTHTYAWGANDASTHKYYCTGCGAVSTTASHNTNVTDTTSAPGYTLKKCSVCNYTVSKTANIYSVTLDNSSSYTAGTTSINATFNAAMPAITIPYRTGYSFDGYYAGQNGTGTKYYNADGTSAHVYDIANAGNLYPNWIKVYDIEVTDTATNSFKFLGK